MRQHYIDHAAPLSMETKQVAEQLQSAIIRSLVHGTSVMDAYFDALEATNPTISMGDTGKILGYRRDALFELLREHGVFSSNDCPYKRYLNEGLFVIRRTGFYKCGMTYTNELPFVTGYGVKFIYELAKKYGLPRTAEMRKLVLSLRRNYELAGCLTISDNV